jgi:hypothetical protein
MKLQRAALVLFIEKEYFNLVEEVNEKPCFTVKMYLAHLMENY